MATKTMELEDESESDLSNSMLGCTVSPTEEKKSLGLATPPEVVHLEQKSTKMQSLPAHHSPSGVAQKRNKHSRQRSRHSNPDSLSITDPDGLRTPIRILESDPSKTPNSSDNVSRGSEAFRSAKSITSVSSKETLKLRTGDAAEEGQAGRPGVYPPRSLRRPKKPMSHKRERDLKAGKATISEPNYEKVSMQLFVEYVSDSDGESSKGEMLHPVFAMPRVPQPTPTGSYAEDMPTNYLVSPANRAARPASPLMTTKHSQKRNGFHWDFTSSSTEKNSLSFPPPRHNQRALSSPNLNSPEILKEIRGPQSPEQISPRLSDSPSHRGSMEAMASRTFCPPTPSNRRTPRSPSIPDLKIELVEPPSVQTAKPRKTVSRLTLNMTTVVHRRSPSAQPVRSRPPPLDLFEIVKLPQPVVGEVIYPEIADPSRRPDSIEWWRKLVTIEGKIDWRLVCTDWEYIPTPEDVGFQLRVNLMVNGKPYVDFSTPVIPHPSTPSPRPWKHLNNMARTPSTDSRMKIFRLLTWNTLADAATRNGFKDKCPGWALQWPYRKENLFKHIKAYDADVICMQEVDKKYWISHWKNALSSLGYEGEYAGSTTYGCAIFYRKSLFRKVRHKVVALDTAVDWARKMKHKVGTDTLRQRFAAMLKSPFMPSTHQQLGEKEKLAKLFNDECRVLKCGRKALIFELERRTVEAEPKRFARPGPLPIPSTPMGAPRGNFEEEKAGSPEDTVYVANVHLYKSDTRPWPFIRLVQAHMVMQALDEMTQGMEKPRVVVAGDFNSAPDSSIYRYMQNGVVSCDDADIKGCTVIPGTLRNPFPLRSAYATILGHEQRYRRKKLVQTSVVEYVWCSKALGPLGVVPIPNEAADKFAVEKLSSDHQPLAVDIAFHFQGIQYSRNSSRRNSMQNDSNSKRGSLDKSSTSRSASTLTVEASGRGSLKMPRLETFAPRKETGRLWQNDDKTDGTADMKLDND
mmetsp:Transcript_33949/g.82316  ORF Transcript_33949/g.82316 Transcript_33949/m.82316 type:complete len:970 (+) Transcript_33949:422-3331(+)